MYQSCEALAKETHRIQDTVGKIYFEILKKKIRAIIELGEFYAALFCTKYSYSV